METLIKTGEVLKIDPKNVVDLYRFIGRYMVWKSEDYEEKWNKLFPDLFQPVEFIKIPLDHIWLPSFMISPIPPTFNGIIKPKRRDAIYHENFSYFDLYKLTYAPNGRLTGAFIDVIVNCYSPDGIIDIQGITLIIEYRASRNPKETLFIHSPVGRNPDTEEELIKAVRTLGWARGKRYSNFLKANSKLIGRLLAIEKSLTTFINFLYVFIYTRV